MIKACAVFCLLGFQATLSYANCLDVAALAKLKQSEIEYLSSKIPPAFKHGLQAKDIQVDVLQSTDASTCEAVLQVTVPEADIQEATAVLAAQPAKKIMLAAQGYALPSQTQNQATFSVNQQTLAIEQADYLQTGDLGKLRANIELMYAFITQKRAALIDAQTNDETWPAGIKTKVVDACTAKHDAQVCSCLSAEYQKVIPPKQMEYILNVEENPYAAATGANESFYQFKAKAQQACAS